ncbi:inorganic phosphate transporter PiT [Clostridia bacterium]|nr:inorganic phosphate transporter PiT [Clostridia bacterium]
MEIGFFDFLRQLTSNIPLLFVFLLTLGVILVNGWTDAPNAIATCVATRSMKPRASIIMAALLNFLGLLVMTWVSKAVAITIYNMVDFGDNTGDALIALCAAMFAIVTWATAAWRFGIPTSESHALIAGLSGAAIAVSGGLSGINWNEWIKVLYGLGFSILLGFGMGWITARLTVFVAKGMDRRRTQKFFRGAQIAGAGAMAFMHGAQDGQKFMSVLILGVVMANGGAVNWDANVPFWIILLCALVMGLGTSIGGLRIIKTVGMDMVKLEKYQGFAADAAAAGCLLVSSLTGMPVSTTHTKTTSIMGVGAAQRFSKVNWSVVKEMVFAWVATFPGCGLIGYLMALLFLKIF